MTNHTLTLSTSELETIQTLMHVTIKKLEVMATEVNEVLDDQLIPVEQYDMYAGCLVNMATDTDNMRSILSRIESKQ